MFLFGAEFGSVVSCVSKVVLQLVSRCCLQKQGSMPHASACEGPAALPPMAILLLERVQESLCRNG